MDYEYDKSEDLYHAHHDFESRDSLATSVVNLIETIEETEQKELSPLYDTIDPEALNALFRPQRHSHRDDGSVWFVFEDYQVTIFADGDIELRLDQKD